MATDPGVIAYGRLSREEIQRDRSTTIEDKIQQRKESLVYLASLHGIRLDIEDIIFDVVTGTEFEERLEFREVLEKCKRRECHTLIVSAIDRVTRDMGHWKYIERCCFLGQIRLITRSGVSHFTPDFNPLSLQVQAVMAGNERWGYSFRVTDANRTRTRKDGRHSQGRPPYGYRWNLSTMAYHADEGEYAVIVRIFDMAFTQGSQAIANALNADGVPPPPSGEKQRKAGGGWREITVQAILKNPFYAGHPAHRVRTDYDRNLKMLPRSEWVLSEKEQDYPHPLSLERWEELQEVRAARLSRGVGKKRGEASAGLLTGLLLCPAGEPMRRQANSYGCSCVARGFFHDGTTIESSRVEEAIVAAWIRRVDSAPLDLLGEERAQANAPELQAEIRKLRRQREELEKNRQEAVRMVERGFASASAMVSEVMGKIADVDDALRMMEREAQEKPPAVPRAWLQRIREDGGASWFWGQFDAGQRRRALADIIDRIERPAPAVRGGHTRYVRVHFLPFEEGNPCDVEEVVLPPKRCRGGGNSHI